MNKEIVQQIINDVYPKIVNHYGKHKGYKVPKIEVHNNVFDRLALIPVLNNGIKKMQGVNYPSGEFCKDENKIFIYFPEIKNKVDLIKALLHEYKHYLQPRWGYEFYNDMGFNYGNHPYELEAISEESNWKKYI
jgi:hypothetical protein